MLISSEEMAEKLRHMTPRDKLFQLIKAEMQERGHWRNKPRGKPYTIGFDKRRKANDKKEGNHNADTTDWGA